MITGSTPVSKAQEARWATGSSETWTPCRWILREPRGWDFRAPCLPGIGRGPSGMGHDLERSCSVHRGWFTRLTAEGHLPAVVPAAACGTIPAVGLPGFKSCPSASWPCAAGQVPSLTSLGLFSGPSSVAPGLWYRVQSPLSAQC